ncbi:MAG: histidine--tRNA ligase [Coriobacteriales bacterium]|jgi:histidyl-tRNA synthetase|nr:histidine--tRNA ligase [Coriobacteriales bacterium]
MSFRAPKGTNDLIAQDAWGYLNICKQAAEIFFRYGYQPIQTPTFESLDAFVRGIGSATDVIGKEMFYVNSATSLEKLIAGVELKADERLALRPEMTAGVARAVLERGVVVADGPLVKLHYAGSMFRHERPQKGRLREFHQIGAECIGSAEPTADAEVIMMFIHFFESLGLPKERFTLLLNSMGDEHCRPAYREQVKQYVLDHAGQLCEDCLRRADTNPLRAFDCKNPNCQSIMAEAPVITDALCPECADHYAEVKRLLDKAGITYVEDPYLVRGLDYYTRTVFELQSDDGQGAQNALGGGGRYDRLLQEFGDKSIPGLGFAIGCERLLMALESRGLKAVMPSVQVYLAAASDDARPTVFLLADELRRNAFSVEIDHQSRSLKSQLKSADRLGAEYLVAIGSDELSCGVATLRSLREDFSVEFGLADAVQNLCIIMQKNKC